MKLIDLSGHGDWNMNCRRSLKKNRRHTGEMSLRWSKELLNKNKWLLFLFGSNSYFFLLSSPYRTLFRSLFGSLKNERKKEKNHRSKLEWNAMISFSLTIIAPVFTSPLLWNSILVIMNKNQSILKSHETRFTLSYHLIK